jgi:hypothetical protein
MNPLNEAIRQDLQWQHPNMFQRVYELRGNATELFATLQYRGMVSSQAIGEASGVHLVFQLEGIIKSRCIVTDAETNTAVASIQRKARGGTVVLTNGKQYEWSKLNFWGTNWGWLDVNHQSVVTFSRNKHLEFAPSIEHALDDLPLLAMLGWYLLLLQRSEAATTAAVSSV